MSDGLESGRGQDGQAGAPPSDAAFAGVAADSFMNGSYHEAVASAAVSAIVFLAGVFWPRIAHSFGPRLSGIAAVVATDFRWWLAVLGLLFVYLAAPPIITAIKNPTTPSDCCLAPPLRNGWPNGPKNNSCVAQFFGDIHAPRVYPPLQGSGPAVSASVEPEIADDMAAARRRVESVR